MTDFEQPFQQPLSQSSKKPSEPLNSDNLAGVLILAGGLSTRMGRPKALLTLPNGDTLLDYHVRQASMFNVPIFIADNGQGFATHIKTAKPIHVVDYEPMDSLQQMSPSSNDDSKHSAGPLGAIMAGMLLSSSPREGRSFDPGKMAKWLMVISCDSLVSAADIWSHVDSSLKALKNNHCDKDETVDEHISTTQVCCLSDAERLYPLLGLYSLSLTQALKDYLDDGNRRVMAFVKPVCHSVIMPTAWQSLSNLNTPVQFELACQFILK